ncbi:MAG TPA: hypothetical protein V6C52_07870 [Coleofasciculaceae cyanobacterium]|jgi:hypothetical protein
MNVNLGWFTPKFGMALHVSDEKRIKSALELSEKEFLRVTGPHAEALARMRKDASQCENLSPICKSNTARQKLEKLVHAALQLNESYAKAFVAEKVEDRPQEVRRIWLHGKSDLDDKVLNLAESLTAHLSQKDANGLMQSLRSHAEEVPKSISQAVLKASSFEMPWGLQSRPSVEGASKPEHP